MIKKIVFILFSSPSIFLTYFYSSIYASILRCREGIRISRGVVIRGKPIIDIYKGCFLEIEDNVTLNSRNRGYHLNMHSPVKLFADRPGAAIKIGKNTRIHGTCLHAYQSITIGSNCLIAANCHIIDGNGHDTSFHDVSNRINTKGSSSPIVIEDDVWVGANCIILPGVTIGRGAVISANSVVIKDIPAMALAGGNPAVVIKSYINIFASEAEMEGLNK